MRWPWCWRRWSGTLRSQRPSWPGLPIFGRGRAPVLRHLHPADQREPPEAQDLAEPAVGASPLPVAAEDLGLMDLGADMVQLLHNKEDDLL